MFERLFIICLIVEWFCFNRTLRVFLLIETYSENQKRVYSSKERILFENSYTQFEDPFERYKVSRNTN